MSSVDLVSRTVTNNGTSAILLLERIYRYGKWSEKTTSILPQKTVTLNRYTKQIKITAN